MRIDVMSKIPIYEQIIGQIEKYVLNGVYSKDEAIPSVRGLSNEISVNPNTIQKAYTALSNEGILFSVPGKGLFISGDAEEKIISKHREDNIKDLTVLLKKLRGFGVEKAEILAIAEKIYEEENL